MKINTINKGIVDTDKFNDIDALLSEKIQELTKLCVENKKMCLLMIEKIPHAWNMVEEKRKPYFWGMIDSWIRGITQNIVYISWDGKNEGEEWKKQ